MKFRILKCGKYTKFIIAMNVFLLASILVCVSGIICGEMFGSICHSQGRTENESESWHVVLSWENEEWECVKLRGKRERERENFQRCRLYRIHVTSPTPNTRSFFERDKIKIRVRSWKHTAHDYSVHSGSRYYLIFRRSTTFISGTSESRMFCSTCSSPVI